jgi:tRNA threonylcarbamoyladenosine biosynthesis protein TsaE
VIVVESSSPEETAGLGAKLGANAFEGTVIVLHGELGAGKTTFTQGIGAGLGIAEVTSPTFVLVAEHAGRLRLYHVDLYRLGDTDDLADLALDEVIGLTGVVVVEWPERYLGEWPADRLAIELSGDDRHRRITFSPTGPRHQSLVERALASS